MRGRWVSCTALLLGLVGCARMDQDVAPADPDATRIGLLASLSGPYGGFGPSVEQATHLAVEEINQAGGVNGKPLSLVVANDKSLLPAGLYGAGALLDAGVVGIVGSSSSSVVLGVAEQVTIPAGLPLVSHSATSPAISMLQDRDTVWRTVPSDAYQGVILADAILAQGVTDVGVIYNGNAYGVGLAQAFKARYQAIGGRVRGYVPYSYNKVVGFAEEVAALLEEGVPSAVLIVGYLGDSANITLDLQQASITPKPRLFGVDANYDPSFLANASTAMVEGMEGTAPAPPATLPTYLSFRERFIRKVGTEPLLYAECAYDAVYLMALAMAAEGASTKEAIVAHLREVSRPSGLAGDVIVTPGEFAKGVAALKAGRHVNYEGASGSIDFDAQGDVTSGTYIWWRVVRGSGGRLTYVTERVIAFP